MKKMFRVNTMFRDTVGVKEFDVISETEKTVTFLNRERKDMQRKNSECYNWVDTEEEATNTSLAILKRRAEKLQKSLDLVNKQIEDFNKRAINLAHNRG